MNEPILELDIDQENRRFLIKGSVTSITKNRRVWSYLRSAYDATIIDENMLVISFLEIDKDVMFADIEQLFKIHHINTIKTSSAEEQFSTYLKEEHNFSEFSDRARDIWDNKFDINEFRKFTDVVSSRLAGRTLYDLQLLASYHLAFSQNACNFSVPGAGKTSIVYAAYAYLNSLDFNNPKHVNKMLVVGPLSSFEPWESEYRNCFSKDVRCKRLSGGISVDERKHCFYSPAPADETPELLLISYQGLASSVEDIESYLIRPDHHVMIVLDEAHHIKNTEGGVWAEAILKVSKYPSARVVLTGTPAPNGYQDLFNLYKFIWPQKNVIGFNPAQLRDMSSTPYDGRVKQLIHNISPYFIRIKKSHLNLPKPIDHQPHFVPMGQIQRKIYDYLEETIISPLLDASDTEVIRNVFTKARLIRLMQAASNPSLLNKPIDDYFGDIPSEAFITDTQVINLIKEYSENEIPEKYKILLERVRNIIAAGEKVVIWAIFVDSMHMIANYLSEHGIHVKLLYGQTPVETDDDDIETRERIIREFHSQTSSFNVLIANPFAVGESISLHRACHRAIYIERNFNAAMFIQSKDRIHRVGLKQDDEIHYEYIVSDDSIESTIHVRLENKVTRMMQIIESQIIPLIDLNMDGEQLETNDVRSVINDYKQRARKN